MLRFVFVVAAEKFFVKKKKAKLHALNFFSRTFSLCLEHTRTNPGLIPKHGDGLKTFFVVEILSLKFKPNFYLFLLVFCSIRDRLYESVSR